MPASIEGVAWSDQWSFWRLGYPALMVTDTAPFRYPHYHEPTDTPDKLDYDRFALVGVRDILSGLADGYIVYAVRLQVLNILRVLLV